MNSSSSAAAVLSVVPGRLAVATEPARTEQNDPREGLGQSPNGLSRHVLTGPVVAARGVDPSSPLAAVVCAASISIQPDSCTDRSRSGSPTR